MSAFDHCLREVDIYMLIATKGWLAHYTSTGQPVCLQTLIGQYRCLRSNYHKCCLCSAAFKLYVHLKHTAAGLKLRQV